MRLRNVRDFYALTLLLAGYPGYLPLFRRALKYVPRHLQLEARLCRERPKVAAVANVM